MTYPETIEFLFSSLPFFQREGAAAYKPGLDNTLSFSELLGSPQRHFESIHIAGTNGKGSTSHMIASVLMASGRRVGLFTSPHLRDFRERIRVDGCMIPEAEVVAFTERWRDEMVARGLTFFEMCTCLALSWFAAQKVDIAVVETGLGGRLDATNIIAPRISIITNVGLDHTVQLGATLPEIAAEKAGIIKPHTPIIVGEHHPEADPVYIRIARAREAPLVFAQDDYCENLPPTDLAGDYQRKNIPAVLAVAELLEIPREALERGLMQVQETTGLQGRWQTLAREPRIVADTAHNPDGMREVVAQLAREEYRNLLIIIGLVADKDADAILAQLPPAARYFFTAPATPRALEADRLARKAAAHGLSGEIHPAAAEALRAAENVAAKEDLILITGSNYLIGEIILNSQFSILN